MILSTKFGSLEVTIDTDRRVVVIHSESDDHEITPDQLRELLRLVLTNGEVQPKPKFVPEVGPIPADVSTRIQDAALEEFVRQQRERAGSIIYELPPGSPRGPIAQWEGQELESGLTCDGAFTS